MSELTSWIWLAELRGVGSRTTAKLLQHFGSAQEVYYASEQELQKVPELHARELRSLLNKDTEEARKIEDACLEQGIRILCLTDAAYPARLRSIPDPPVVLYVKGRMPDIDEIISIAVVGTRRAGEYGKTTAERLGRELASAGAAVVTGMAEGIDSAAARGTLAAHGIVIGVLGTGVDVVYPRWNEKLQTAVGRLGALVSEYPPGRGATRGSFPQRNRIISGLSLGVVVVEAPKRSGSLITASQAQEQGRDIFAVPGLANDPNFEGSHALIRDGAQLAGSGKDILEAYRFRYPHKLRKKAAVSPKTPAESEKKPLDTPQKPDYSLREQLEELSEAELKLVGLLAEGPKTSDLLIRGSGRNSGEVLAALTMLQIKGYISETNGQYRLEMEQN